jgi:hypothetical protein
VRFGLHSLCGRHILPTLLLSLYNVMSQITPKMDTKISRPSSWLHASLLASFLFTQLPAVCMAQDSTSNDAASVTANARVSSSISSQASSTSSAPAQTHTVQVGLADHKFNPDVTEAEVGDVSNIPQILPWTLYIAAHILTSAPDHRIQLLPCQPQRRPRRIRLPLVLSLSSHPRCCCLSNRSTAFPTK